MRTPEEIRVAGLRALKRELGIVGMIRFLQQYESGRGDYSLDRREWLDDGDVGTIVSKIRRGSDRRKKPSDVNP